MLSREELLVNITQLVNVKLSLLQRDYPLPGIKERDMRSLDEAIAAFGRQLAALPEDEAEPEDTAEAETAEDAEFIYVDESVVSVMGLSSAAMRWGHTVTFQRVSHHEDMTFLWQVEGRDAHEFALRWLVTTA